MVTKNDECPLLLRNRCSKFRNWMKNIIAKTTQAIVRRVLLLLMALLLLHDDDDDREVILVVVVVILDEEVMDDDGSILSTGRGLGGGKIHQASSSPLGMRNS